MTDTLAAPATPGFSFTLAAGEGRTPAPLNIVGEETLVLVGNDDAQGQFSAFHLVAPPMSGPPLHVHSREDEWFYVLDGELVFELDGARHTVAAGGSVWLRRGVVHAYQNFTDRDARLLIVTAPGTFQHFFEELSAATPVAGPPDMAVFGEIHERYGITMLGPPMMR